MTDLVVAWLDALDEEAHARLAASLAPHLARLLRYPPDERPDDGWMNSRQAADYLGMTKHALHKLTAGRFVPFHQDRPGCKLYFKRSELDEWRQSGGAR